MLLFPGSNPGLKSKQVSRCTRAPPPPHITSSQTPPTRYDIVSEKATHYLVMPLADGGTLNDQVRLLQDPRALSRQGPLTRHGPLTLLGRCWQIGRHPGAETILAWMSDVASAFEYIHGLRVYHRY